MATTSGRARLCEPAYWPRLPLCAHQALCMPACLSEGASRLFSSFLPLPTGDTKLLTVPLPVLGFFSFLF